MKNTTLQITTKVLNEYKPNIIKNNNFRNDIATNMNEFVFDISSGDIQFQRLNKEEKYELNNLPNKGISELLRALLLFKYGHIDINKQPPCGVYAELIQYGIDKFEEPATKVRNKFGTSTTNEIINKLIAVN